MLVAAPSIAGGRLKPNRSAVRTSRSGPSSAPRGAKTELQECAKDSISVAAARLAVGVLQLDALERGRRLHREVSCGRVISAPRARPASVMILNVEPGGCRPERPIPAAATTSPSSLPPTRIATTPPRRPASAVTAAAWTCGMIVVRTGVGLDRLGGGEHARARAQAPAGLAAQLVVERALEPGEPDLRVLGTPFARELLGALGRDRPQLAADRGRGRRVELVALRVEERGARRELQRALELLARLEAGERHLGRPRDAVLLHRQRRASRAPARRRACRRTTSVPTTPSSGLRRRRPRSGARSRCASRRRAPRRTPRALKRCFAASVSSAYIAA